MDKNKKKKKTVYISNFKKLKKGRDKIFFVRLQVSQMHTIIDEVESIWQVCSLVKCDRKQSQVPARHTEGWDNYVIYILQQIPNSTWKHVWKDQILIFQAMYQIEWKQVRNQFTN